MKLEGKTALVTGGNSGIGLAIARRFAQAGARVFIAGRDQARLDAAVASIGERAEAIRADVTDSAELDALFEQLRARCATLDILVTSSGVSEPATLEQTTEAHFDKIFDLNVRAMVFTVQRAVRQMGSGGAIVLVGSVASSMGNPGYAAYSATKAAVRSYTRSWTGELAGRGIRVNTLSPGPTNTPMFDQVSDAYRQAIEARIPFKRMAQADEIADAALFLASPDSRYVGGADLVVDGGLLA
ncbi:SDR family NAD(P)-dependent oxidoreductase [Massilia sp. 9096]|uniref:SDR family NAD(P)-dependent oxidoreductase n=1 Tax=Massilia sp. 9096 TaxID=1500894 RepID=UPI00056BBEA0|nr:glucose 1-dehydrogenase [Massilia sp. 9096]